MNDLHTAEVTTELAGVTGASALINADQDRNDVDLNRIVEAHERAPWFLEQLAEVLDRVLARHGRATLLAMHGWNVVQPVVDLGLGCAPGENPYVVGRAAAVSGGFAAGTLPRLVGACAARGIVATIGARYPARNRENLLQLFTPRYRDDPRPLVRALAALAPRVDAVQMELGIALRWPGSSRAMLLAACAEALPALVAPPDRASAPEGSAVAPDPLPPRRLEFASSALCGLAGVDRGRGGRLLLFPPEGGLVLFTGERVGLAPGGLAFRAGAGGALTVEFRGPLLRFPDTTPFLDLETGLASARLIQAEVELAFVPDHPALEGADFGAVSGRVVLDGVEHAIAARGFAEDGGAQGPWPRVRAALSLPDGASLSVIVGLEGDQASGFLCRHGRHVAVAAARATIGSTHAALENVRLDVDLVDGERLRVAAHAIHRLPVIRARGAAAVRVEFAACGLDGVAGDATPAGWVEAGGF